MKIDKRNPRHWLALTLFGFNVAGALLLRNIFPLRLRRGIKRDASDEPIPPTLRADPLRPEGGDNPPPPSAGSTSPLPPPSEGRGIEGDAGRRRSNARKLVLLYGHKLNGNLLALYNHWRDHATDEFDFVFLTMDKPYHRKLQAEGIESALATRPSTLALLARADAVISDHGLHVMSLLVGRTTIKFFDVWHGFGFKGHRAHDFRLQHKYDEMWVSSPLQRRFYIERFGFDAARVKATGYARMDRLVRQDEDTNTIKKSLGLDAPGTGKIILFAPTWKNDDAGHSVYPFGLSREAFLAPLSGLARRTQSSVVIRSHLNTRMAVIERHPRIHWMSASDFPDTEAMLLISDILICDWSSIAFDWLLLDRPTIFLDVTAPFPHGFTLEPGDRYGRLAADRDELLGKVDAYLENPNNYHRHYGARAHRIRERVFGRCADGRAASRCFERLRHALELPTE